VSWSIFINVDSNRHQGAPLRLVAQPESSTPQRHALHAPVVVREIDWSILMARAQSGDREAYRRLLDDLVPYVRSLAVAFHRDPRDIEDSVQDVLLSVHAFRHTYDPLRPFGPWLVSIARRRIVDRLRRQGRTTAHEIPLGPEHEMVIAAQEEDAGATVDASAVREAVSRLPPGQREAIDLMKLREMSLRQAATVSGMSIGALKVATHRGMKNLRKLLLRSKDAG